MDRRRLSTLDILGSGILDQPAPETSYPDDVDWYEPFESDLEESEVRKALEEGRGATCSEYYGIPYVWKEGDKYKGELLQYREVTETFETEDIEVAIDSFMSWYRSCYG